MEERKGSTEIQEEIEIPTDIQEEITKLRKKEKFLSYAVAGFLIIGVLVGFKAYFADSASAQYENYGTNQTVLPLGAGAGAGGSAGAGGCCGSGGSGSATGTQLTPEEMQAQALDLYKQETGKTDVKAVVSDRGCHTQIDLVDAKGTIVKSYGYQGGDKVYPII